MRLLVEVSDNSYDELCRSLAHMEVIHRANAMDSKRADVHDRYENIVAANRAIKMGRDRWERHVRAHHL